LIITAVAVTLGCNKISYRKTKSGLVYKIFPSDSKDSLLKNGQIIKYNATYKLNDDSLLYTTYGKAPQYAIVQSETSPYDSKEIFPMMKKGDSAVTVQLIDTLLKKGVQLPFTPKKGDKIVTTFHIIEVFNTDSIARADYDKEMEKDKPRQMKEQQEQMAKMEKDAKEQQAKEDIELEKSGEIAKEIQTMEAYLANKKISAQKTGKGTFVHIESQGTGPAAAEGSYVNVKYTGKHLETDSTFQSNSYAFQLGKDPVVRGWTEGLKLFKQGGKGTLFIPGFLAYGKNPPAGSPFKPFEPLKFDIELLEVSDKPINQKTQ
jgi:FKBP-type peptidyl-prolyl cis-trans isomerase FkpA